MNDMGIVENDSYLKEWLAEVSNQSSDGWTVIVRSNGWTAVTNLELSALRVYHQLSYIYGNITYDNTVPQGYEIKVVYDNSNGMNKEFTI